MNKSERYNIIKTYREHKVEFGKYGRQNAGKQIGIRTTERQLRKERKKRGGGGGGERER